MNLSLFDARILEFADFHAAKYLSDEYDFGYTYYDAAAVYSGLFERYGRQQYLDVSVRCSQKFLDEYVLQNNGGAAAWWNFTTGLTKNWFRHGDVKYRDAVTLLASNAAYCHDATPLDRVVDSKMSREVAYAIRAYINAEQCGQLRRQKLRQYVDIAIGHCNQWFIDKSDSEYAPFMFGLTGEALALYHDYIEPDAAIVEALSRGALWTWTNAWVGDGAGFWYRMSDQTTAAPDLNMIVANVYGWLYKTTGDRIFKTIGDQVFDGGVQGAWLNGSKQFNQAALYALMYLKHTSCCS